jgi:hypothetical protein
LTKFATKWDLFTIDLIDSLLFKAKSASLGDDPRSESLALCWIEYLLGDKSFVGENLKGDRALRVIESVLFLETTRKWGILQLLTDITGTKTYPFLSALSISEGHATKKRKQGTQLQVQLCKRVTNETEYNGYRPKPQ